MKNAEHEQEHGAQQDSSYGRYDLGLKSFVRSLRIAFMIMAALIIGMLVFFFAFGGFVIVSPQESVLLVRFGKVHAVWDKGWYWAFPRPVNEFIRIPKTPKTFFVSFLAQPERGSLNPGASLAPGRDRYLLTADANIIHTRWRVVYRVNNARTYYERVIAATSPFANELMQKLHPSDEAYYGGPIVLMQNMLRDIVIRTTAAHSVEQALYNNQPYISQVQDSFVNAVADMDLGVVVDAVTIDTAQPPLKTKAAFDEVSIARQEREKMISEALSYRVEQENQALSEEVRIKAEAENYRTRVASEIKSEVFYFNKINEEYMRSPETVLVSLYNYTLADVLALTKEKFIIHKSARGNQEVRLKINPEPIQKKLINNNNENRG
ncbi:MAG: SPFH domain-containing protein [Victivallales bacterium]|nr:SPFH domain-containing protein [Victivallales bacterium]